MKNKPINPLYRVLVVEDDAIIAQLITSDLQAVGHTVIDIIHNGDLALDAIHNHEPDLIMLDIHLEGSLDGIDLGKIIRDKYDIPFIFLTAFSDAGTLARAAIAEPSAYLVKPYKASDLISAITIGMFKYDHRQKDHEITEEKVNAMAVKPLSSREFDIVLDLAEGLTNGQICEKQHLSLSTVKWHLQNIYAKLDVPNRTSAVRMVLG